MLELRGRVEKIIANRKACLPKAQGPAFDLDRNLEHVRELDTAMETLQSHSEELDEEMSAELAEIHDDIHVQIERLAEDQCALQALVARLQRNTVNIGVSGLARVGKSTTLQVFSGLSDQQIPAGSGKPVTAVRSTIVNSDENHAEFCMHDRQSFVSEVIAPALGQVNRYTAFPINVSGIDDLKTVQLPDTLGNNVDTRASAALEDLKAIQGCLGCLEPNLTGGVRTEDLSRIREFVAYPAQEDESSSARLYLAVRSAVIYHRFPSLDDAPIALVDLPGLGEIESTKARMHMQGLENNVDQVLMIMRPTKDSAFVDAGIANNIDQLRTIQPGIKHRGSLIVAAINLCDDNTESAKVLECDFERKINAAQESDSIKLMQYCAIDQEDVARLFDSILDKLVDDLPEMDNDSLSYVMNERIGVSLRQLDETKRRLASWCNRVQKTIPLEATYLARLGDEVGRNLIASYCQLEERQYAKINQQSSRRQEFENHVKAIHRRNARELKEGFFLGSDRVWNQYSRGRADYASFYRSEARRIRAELIESYRNIDIFYSDEIEVLKKEILDAFFSCTGNFRLLMPRNNSESSVLIEVLAEELESTVRSARLSSAFRFLLDLKFKFTQNVFYHIYESLELLHNPGDCDEFEARGMSTEAKNSHVKNALLRIAQNGNDEIKKQICGYSDMFNRYLFTCASFFNDFLFRRDEDGFKRCIELLVSVRRDLVVPDAEVVVRSKLGAPISRIRRLLEDIHIDGVEASTQPDEVSLRIEPSFKTKTGESCDADEEQAFGPDRTDAGALKGNETIVHLGEADATSSYTSAYGQAWK